MRCLLMTILEAIQTAIFLLTDRPATEQEHPAETHGRGWPDNDLTRPSLGSVWAYTGSTERCYYLYAKIDRT